MEGCGSGGCGDRLGPGVSEGPRVYGQGGMDGCLRAACRSIRQIGRPVALQPQPPQSPRITGATAGRETSRRPSTTGMNEWLVPGVISVDGPAGPSITSTA